MGAESSIVEFSYGTFTLLQTFLFIFIIQRRSHYNIYNSKSIIKKACDINMRITDQVLDLY